MANGGRLPWQADCFAKDLGQMLFAARFLTGSLVSAFSSTATILRGRIELGFLVNARM